MMTQDIGLHVTGHSFIHAYMYIFNMYMYIANARTLHTTSIGLQIG